MDQAPGGFQVGQWHACLLMYGLVLSNDKTGCCFCCSGQVTQHTFECGHVLPRSKGGSDMMDNLRVLCRACNRSMGSRDLLEFKTKYFET